MCYKCLVLVMMQFCIKWIFFEFSPKKRNLQSDLTDRRFYMLMCFFSILFEKIYEMIHYIF